MVLGFGWNDLMEMFRNGTWDDYAKSLLDRYENLGPIPGIGLPFLEAFLPFLPLVVFVLTNTVAYGLLWGFLYSWIGTSLGAITVFWLIRRYQHTRVINWLRHNKQVNRITEWLDRHGFGPLFILLCFPFSPSAIINVVAGLSRISVQQFALAVFLGKALMIFSIAYVGDSLTSFAENPIKTVVVAVAIILFWMVGKYVEGRLKKKNGKQEQSHKD
ncbi:TVP38/TMEM64 family protein [Terribacillus saccharophilus]|nr:MULTISPECIES: TVP38/TMEM64 family protein [Terribacillus]MCM3226808.1 TVP38/TMEM64 family protein [Terribacillus saccharophilus]MEC0303297.1 TVP38/TMEM64 family protein [Terribacillus saccharophilus]